MFIMNVFDYFAGGSVVAKTALLVIIVIVVAYLRWQAQRDKRIATLGSRAARWEKRLPLGIDFVWGNVREHMRDRDFEFWRDGIARNANPANPYTTEADAGGQRIIVTIDPENIKAILATQFADYGKGQPFNEDWHDFLGDSIFSTDHRKWQDSRQLLRPLFIKDRIADLVIFESTLNQLLPRLGGQGQTVDVADLFCRFTLDATAHVLLGRSVNSLIDPKVRFAEAFVNAQNVLSMRIRAGDFRFLIPKNKSFYANIEAIDDFIDPIVEQVLQLSEDELAKLTKSDTEYTFLHAMAQYTRDRKVLRDQIIGVLLAGRDTTAGTLSWLIYELCKAPHIVEKLRDEIKEVVGLDQPPTYAQLKSMKYLQHCLSEILRLYPAVPFNLRLALKNTTLPRGGGPNGDEPVGVLRHTMIAYSTLILHHREDLYPPASSGFPPIASFVPERWDIWSPKPWTYIPFNGGPRICIGQQFALAEMGYVVVRMFQRFKRIESRLDGREPGRRTDITIQPVGGVQVAFFDEDHK